MLLVRSASPCHSQCLAKPCALNPARLCACFMMPRHCAEYTGLGKLKFSSRLFDNRAVKEWYKKNKHRVEVGSLVSRLSGRAGGQSPALPEGEVVTDVRRQSADSEGAAR
jgi:hypothetical protein